MLREQDWHTEVRDSKEWAETIEEADHKEQLADVLHCQGRDEAETAMIMAAEHKQQRLVFLWPDREAAHQVPFGVEVSSAVVFRKFEIVADVTGDPNGRTDRLRWHKQRCRPQPRRCGSAWSEPTLAIGRSTSTTRCDSSESGLPQTFRYTWQGRSGMLGPIRWSRDKGTAVVRLIRVDPKDLCEMFAHSGKQGVFMDVARGDDFQRIEIR